MRMHIIKVAKSEQVRPYLDKTLNIQSWFCEKENLPKVTEVELLGESELAMQFLFGKKAHWIPKSIMTITKRKEKLLEDF